MVIALTIYGSWYERRFLCVAPQTCRKRKTSDTLRQPSLAPEV